MRRSSHKTDAVSSLMQRSGPINCNAVERSLQSSVYMNYSVDSIETDFEVEESPSRGSNFLVSAVMILRRQRQELQSELAKLRERVAILETQNAGLVNLGADRLLRK